MKTKNALITGFAMLGVLVICTLAVYGRLPDLLPIHWNFRGEADGWAAKHIAVVMGPAALLVMLGLMVGLPAISPRQFAVTTFRGTFNYLMLVGAAMMGYLHLLMLFAGLHSGLNFNRAFMSGLFLFIALVGNMMGKTRRNFWMGIRTPWTLASDKVWDATHRLAGRLMVGAGVVGFMLALPGVSPIICIVLLAFSLLYPVVFSYFLYRQKDGGGA